MVQCSMKYEPSIPQTLTDFECKSYEYCTWWARLGYNSRLNLEQRLAATINTFVSILYQLICSILNTT